MKILIFGWRDPKHPQAGGAEQVVHEHAKGWIKAGHKVTLFSSFYKGGLNSEVIDGVNVIRKGYQILGVHVAGFLWYVFGKHDKYDLVIDQFHGIPFFTPLYVRRPKLAILQEVAKEVWLINHLPKPWNLLFGYIGYLCEPLMFAIYRVVPFMVGSDSAKKDLINMGIPDRNITIVPHGVNIITLKPLPAKEKSKTIIFLGSLSRDKGIEDAIKCFSILDKMGKYQYWVVGKGGDTYLHELRELGRRVGIWKKIKYYGYVGEVKKFELLSRAHVMINPSIREGWGLVNIEANAVGTPVVGYNSTGLIDSVCNNFSGLILEKNDPFELARVTNDLLNHNDKYNKLREGAIRWSKNFSWVKSRKKSLELTKKVVYS